jgi:hypothetical protein
MRKIVAVITVLFLLCGLSLALSLSAGGGMLIGMGIKSFDYNMKFTNLGMGISLGLFSNVELEANISYHPGYNSKSLEGYEEGVVKWKMLETTAGIRMKLFSTVITPYLAAGGGLYKITIEDGDPDDGIAVTEDTENCFGVYLGMGIKVFALPRLAVHTPLKAHFVLVETEGYEPWEVKYPLFITAGIGVEYTLF